MKIKAEPVVEIEEDENTKLSKEIVIWIKNVEKVIIKKC